MNDDDAKKILEVATNHANGYRRANTQFSTDSEKDVNEKCATAASNTAWFILSGFGYSPDRIRELHEEVVKEGRIIKWED